MKNELKIKTKNMEEINYDDMSNVVRDYFNIYNEKTKQFDKIALLYQLGKFYEVYELIEFIDEGKTLRQGNAKEIADLLTLKYIEPNKSKGNRRYNYAGFPLVSYDKYAEVLINNNYTVIRVDEITKKISNKSAPVDRAVTEILSPATYISDKVSNKINDVNNNLMCIYIEFQKYGTIKENFDEYVITCGVSIIDISTGKNTISEMYSLIENKLNALQELYRFILSNPSREILLYIHDLPKESLEYIEYVVDTLNLNNVDKFIIRDSIPKEMLKLEYQEQFLSKLFKIEYTHVLEGLGLERIKYGLISYVLMCQYCYEIDDKLLSIIELPNVSWLNEDKYCILTHNAILQLDILPTDKSLKVRSNKDNKIINSLLSIVDNTNTMLGKRYLKRMILNPITNIDELENMYNITEELMESKNVKDGLYEQLIKSLSNVYDVERLYRKLQTKTIKPIELCQLHASYKELIIISTITHNSETKYLKQMFTNFFTQEKASNFNNFYTSLEQTFNINNLQTAIITKTGITAEGNILNYDNNNYHMIISEYEERLEMICNHLNTFLVKNSGKGVVFPEDKSIKTTLTTTAAKGNVLKKNLHLIDEKLCGKIQITNTGTKSIITSDVITGLCNGLEHYNNENSKNMYNVYMEFINTSINTFNSYNNASQFLSLIDYLCNNAKVAIKNGYYRPVIDSNNEISYVDVEELRHPIIERIIKGKYITNDIRLDEKKLGILLYGVNSCGKSSLAKALGLSIIMAQAGMFVPCKMKFTPKTSIITRLSGNDDLLKGYSSFVVEMSELRTILRNSNSKTLVLGDELCKGTENTSASALTLATLKFLITKFKCNFIFSTHLHNIASTKHMKELEEKINIVHLETIFEEDTEKLIYNRKLSKGVGKTTYGIEVAKWLKLDPEFIQLANNIRKEIMNESTLFLNTKTSRYNSKIYVDECGMCKSKISLHVHHIEPQESADENNMIGYFHKNTAFNLMVVCEKCHYNIHHGNKTTQ